MDSSIKKENLYKWRFLRLNKDYRGDFDKLKKIKDDEYYENHFNHICSKWDLEKPLDYREKELIEDIFSNFDGIVQFDKNKYSELYSLDSTALQKNRNATLGKHFDSGLEFLGNEPRFLNIVLDLYSDIDFNELKKKIKTSKSELNPDIKRVQMNEENLNSLIQIYELGAKHLGGKTLYKIRDVMNIEKHNDAKSKLERATSIVENIVFFNQTFTL